MERDAVISECGKYRYLLRRAWDHDKPRALFVMLNPSTADASVDDATIRSCIRLCKAMDYGALEVVNLFAWRATDPDELWKVPEPVGVKTAETAREALARCRTAICAWGAHPFVDRNAISRRFYVEAIEAAHVRAYCLGRTKSGAPKHPLYIKTGTPLEAYRPRTPARLRQSACASSSPASRPSTR